MSIRKHKRDVVILDEQQIKHYITELRQELFALRLNASTDHVKDYSQFKKIRRSIAVATTYLSQKRMSKD